LGGTIAVESTEGWDAAGDLAGRGGSRPEIAVPIRLVLADGHPLLLRGLDALFRSEPGFEVLAQCKDGVEALAAVRAHRPAVLILDLCMPRKDGLAVLRDIKKEQLPTRVVFLVAELGDEQFVEATRLGVSGVVLKEMAPRLLVQCVRKVSAGKPWVERHSAAHAIATLVRREAAAREIGRVLTAREIEIARLTVTGLPNKAIAKILSVGEGTIKTHLHHIYEKLHTRSRVELILYCKDKGFV
jgi:two-component system nitrate/nitrite response regulator NarL